MGCVKKQVLYGSKRSGEQTLPTTMETIAQGLVILPCFFFSSMWYAVPGKRLKRKVAKHPKSKMRRLILKAPWIDLSSTMSANGCNYYRMSILRRLITTLQLFLPHMKSLEFLEEGAIDIQLVHNVHSLVFSSSFPFFPHPNSKFDKQRIFLSTYQTRCKVSTFSAPT